MLLAYELILHELVLKVQLKHLFMILFKENVEHIREDILLNQLDLLCCGLLFSQGFYLGLLFFLCFLDEQVPQGLLLLEGTLMLCQEVVKH